MQTVRTYGTYGGYAENLGRLAGSGSQSVDGESRASRCGVACNILSGSPRLNQPMGFALQSQSANCYSRHSLNCSASTIHQNLSSCIVQIHLTDLGAQTSSVSSC